MFYFQQLLQQGLNGIDATAMIPTIVAVSYTVLLIGFLTGLYQAALRGGDVQTLAIAAIKYLVVAAVLANWSTVFREVNDSFNQVAQFIDNSSGAGDMFLGWLDQIKQQFIANGSSAILPAITSSFAAITTALLLLGAYLIYAMMVVVFAFFYVLYGCVLYVLGPLVLALLPIVGLGQLARAYVTNMMMWNAWGVLYAVFGSLITAIQFNRIDAVISQGFLRGFFVGSADSTIIGLVSVFYALALGLIPFIARRLISGDAGATASSLVKAGTSAANAALAAISGFGALPGAPAVATASPGSSSTPSPASAAAISSSSPPPQPGFAETIRGGIMSALSPAIPPAPPVVTSAITQAGAERSQSLSSVPARAAEKSFQPLGLTERMAFQAGKLTRTAVNAVAHSGDDKT